MNKKNDKCITYGVSTIFAGLFVTIVLFNILFFIEDGRVFAYITAIIGLSITLLLSYRKYLLMNERKQTSFIRVVVFDSIFASLSFFSLFLFIEYHYCNLFSFLIVGLSYIPLIYTNKKIPMLNG